MIGSYVKLTDRECEVLQGLAKGLAIKEIARKLVISEIRVNQLVASIKDKFEAPSSTAAVARAVKRGQVDVE